MADKTIFPETQKKIDDFEASDVAFRAIMNDFEDKAPEWFKMIEAARDNRNRALDEAVRALREDAKQVDVNKIKTFKAGPFTVQKKLTKFFAPDLFYNIAKTLGMVDGAISEGAIAEKIEINYEPGMAWIKKNDLWDKFKDSYKETELTPAIGGPKEVPPLGATLKTRDK